MNKVHGAVIVTRVSTGEQAKYGTSLEAQLEAGRAKAALLGLTIVAEYEDAGKSGAFLQMRDGMQRAIADIIACRADTLICANLSRYSRDVEHQQRIKKEVRAAGGRLVFCDMNFDDTPEGDLNFTIQGGFAEYERKVIRKRCIDGKRRRASEGIQCARTQSPYGYHIPTRDEVLLGLYKPDDLGKYLIVGDQARVVKRIYESYASGTHSLHQLSKDLNADRIPTARGKGLWLRSTLRHILLNPAYKGLMVSSKWEGYQDEKRLSEINPDTGSPYVTPNTRRLRPENQWIEIPCPAIVSQEMWKKVQERLDENRLRLGGNPKKMRMLSGLLACPDCGGKMQFRPRRQDRRVDSYVCTLNDTHRDHAGTQVCSNMRYPKATIEQAVISSILDACERPESIQQAIEAMSTKRPSSDRAEAMREVRSIDGALKELGEEEEAAARAQIAGIRQGASPDTYSAIFADLAARRKDLSDRRGQLSRLLRAEESADPKKPRKYSVPEIVDMARKALSSEHVPDAEKRKIVGALVSKIVCQPEGADIVYLPGVLTDDTVQSILVTTPSGHVVLIDGGGSIERESMEHADRHDPDASDDDAQSSDPHDIGRQVVVPYLHFRGIDHIDMIILTHPHGDHVGGLPAVLEDEPVGCVLDGTVLPYPSHAYREFREMVAARRIPYYHAARGMRIDFRDGVTGDVLNPPAYGTPYGTDDGNTTVNNYSVVLRLTYGTTHMLLDGDAEQEAEDSMIASCGDVSGDFLKCGHHGASNATSDEWLNAVSPRYAAISCGLHNIFGHPRPDTLARLAAHNVTTFRTDHDGAITAVSDGHTVEVMQTVK